MLDAKDLLEHAEQCRALADLSRMPSVSRRLRALAQRYTGLAQDIERQDTRPQIDATDAPGLVGDQARQ